MDLFKYLGVYREHASDALVGNYEVVSSELS